MKVLLIGSGGREHALLRALTLSRSINEVHVAPGSDAMANEAKTFAGIAVDTDNMTAVLQLVKREAYNLVVIGPESPLAFGLADELRAEGCLVFGPSKEAAQLESSKVWSKEFLLRARIPTAHAVVVDSVAAVKAAINETVQQFTPPYVLKADGLAAGKGVFICANKAGLLAAAESLFVQKQLGEAGRKALLEQFTPGYELSFLLLTNGEDFEPLLLAQDHKRLKEADLGPNTGGMGAVAPMAISAALREQVETQIVRPTLKQMFREKLLYRGVLYIGLMVTPSGPSVIEFNVRFGDPEAQVILPLLDDSVSSEQTLAMDWGRAFFEVASGRVPHLRWKNHAAACVVLAAEGYPEAPVRGAVMSGNLTGDSAKYFLHSGTDYSSGEWRTNGGRVLNAIGLGADLKEALENAYAQAAQVKWHGLQMRGDIGKR